MGRPRVNFACRVDGCDKDAKQRKMCWMHYTRVRRHGSTDFPKRKIRRCEIEGCDRKHNGHGYCAMHYQRWRVHGDPHFNYRELTQGQRFWSKVNKREGGCWEWTGAKCRDGYGRFNFNATTTTAHRASLRIAGVDLIEGLVIDHTCYNRACVNPDHLEQVTIQENSRRRRTSRA